MSAVAETGRSSCPGSEVGCALKLDIDDSSSRLQPTVPCIARPTAAFEDSEQELPTHWGGGPWLSECQQTADQRTSGRDCVPTAAGHFRPGEPACLVVQCKAGALIARTAWSNHAEQVLAIDFELVGFELDRANGPAKIRVRVRVRAGSTTPCARHHPDVQIANASVRLLRSRVGRCTALFAAAQTARHGSASLKR